MSRLLTWLPRHPRHWLILLCAEVMFLLWLGVWVRVLENRPSFEWPVEDRTGPECFSEDGRILVTVSRRDTPWGPLGFGPIQVWDTRGGKQLASFLDDETWVEHVRTSTTGGLLVAGTAARVGDCGQGSLHVFDYHQGTEVWRNQPSDIYRTYWGMTNDGRRLAYMEHDSSGSAITVWDFHDCRQHLKLSGHAGPVAFSEDGSLLCCVARAELPTVRVYEAKTGRDILAIPFPDGESELERMRFRHGSRAISLHFCGIRGELRDRLQTYDSGNGQLMADRVMDATDFNGYGLPRLAEFEERPGARRWRLETFLVLESGTTQLGVWESNSCRLVRLIPCDVLRSGVTLRGNGTFSNDGTRLAIVTTDNRLQVWELPHRPIFGYVVLATVSAFLLTVALWWRLGR
jgi:WD40 repeat protein